jgi:hypothetical protein
MPEASGVTSKSKCPCESLISDLYTEYMNGYYPAFCKSVNLWKLTSPTLVQR